MNPQVTRFLTKVYQLPILGDLICYFGYAFMKLFTPLNLVLLGFERMRFGTSVIWTPRNKKQTILDGIEFLRNHDSEMFLRFTKKQRLVIYYSHNRSDTNSFGHVFGLHKRYLEIGAEGVASFIVQSLLLSDACSSINQCKLNDRERAGLKVAPRQTMEWMRQHSFHPKLINAYSKMAEKWEQSERFK
jgi:hypothetical protein